MLSRPQTFHSSKVMLKKDKGRLINKDFLYIITQVYKIKLLHFTMIFSENLCLVLEPLQVCQVLAGVVESLPPECVQVCLPREPGTAFCIVPLVHDWVGHLWNMTAISRRLQLDWEDKHSTWLRNRLDEKISTAKPITQNKFSMFLPAD